MTRRVLNDEGRRWAWKLLGTEFQFRKTNNDDPHQCRAVKYSVKWTEDGIPNLLLECKHGGQFVRSIDFKYRTPDWQEAAFGQSG